MSNDFMKKPNGDYELQEEYDLSQLLIMPKGRYSKGKNDYRESKVRIMNIIQEAEKILSTMTRAEKAQVLQWVARDLGDDFPGIDSESSVCGGEPCIVRTRIPVWVLVQARRLGMSEADLLRSYPTLRAEDLVNAWGYYRTHSHEIDQQIRENEGA
jgi:uncharacterized protein (DUF433 family)